MGNAVHQVRAYVVEALASARLLLPVIAEFARGRADGAPETQWAIERVQRTLSGHQEELTEHLTRLGGHALLAGLNGASPDGQSIASVRDLYSRLIAAHERMLMLETNSRALGFSSTAALARRHREEVDTLLMRLRDALPATVKGEIEKEPIF